MIQGGKGANGFYKKLKLSSNQSSISNLVEIVSE
jgi:hypothetical protein